MYARRLLLAAVVVAAFTLVAQQQVGAALSDATTAAPGGSARLDQAHARTASIDGKRLDITPVNLSSDAILERLRSAVFPMQVRGAWGAYAESDETVYPATSAIEKSDDPPAWQRPVSPESGCWWLWLVTGMPVCS